MKELGFVAGPIVLHCGAVGVVDDLLPRELVDDGYGFAIGTGDDVTVVLLPPRLSTRYLDAPKGHREVPRLITKQLLCPGTQFSGERTHILEALVDEFCLCIAPPAPLLEDWGETHVCDFLGARGVEHNPYGILPVLW